jgi:hypothetical protein
MWLETWLWFQKMKSCVQARSTSWYLRLVSFSIPHYYCAQQSLHVLYASRKKALQQQYTSWWCSFCVTAGHKSMRLTQITHALLSLHFLLTSWASYSKHLLSPHYFNTIFHALYKLNLYRIYFVNIVKYCVYRTWNICLPSQVRFLFFWSRSQGSKRPISYYYPILFSNTVIN